MTTASGERLRFREIEPGDTSAIERLYRELDAESTYRRFFTATRPPPSYLSSLTHLAERGGCSIVVEDRSADEPGRIVAEANVVPLANGNGELAVTVERAWRGWLGPYLFGLLRARAAELDIPNVEAEILTCNRPMRALTRRAGEAVYPPEDWQTIRVVVASSGTAPSWPPASTRRVLVEARSANTPALAELVAHGYDVMACTGRRTGGGSCPMLDSGDDCPLARDADVIVVAERDAVRRDELVAGHAARHPEVPVVTLDGERPPDGASLLAAVAAELD